LTLSGFEITSMKFKRFWTMFLARNREFFRDRAAFGWNFAFPFLLVAGFSIIFGGEERAEYKVGIFPSTIEKIDVQKVNIPDRFRKAQYVEFIGFESKEKGLEKLKHHKIDFLLSHGLPPYHYWVSSSSPKGYVLENIFINSLTSFDSQKSARKQEINGREIEYIDWLFPGILAMNMMFSALWGVGYVVVRYRKIGVLKRLKATPLTAFEYLSAQMLSRIFILMFSLIVVWTGCDMILSFKVEGSYISLIIVFLIGSLSLTSMGLVLAARGTSEEFATGALNFITWPMMFLSEVWFSLEGSPQWLKAFSQIFPLTHLLTAARKIMNDGAGLLEVSSEITILIGMTVLFLVLSASLFSWNK